MPCTGRKRTMDELNEKFFMQITELLVVALCIFRAWLSLCIFLLVYKEGYTFNSYLFLFSYSIKDYNIVFTSNVCI